MKKLLTVILLLLVCGCSSSKETNFVAVLLNDATDSGMIVFLDEKGIVIDEKKVDYPYHLHYQDDLLYYSYDAVNYSAVNMKTRSDKEGFYDVHSSVLHFYRNGDYIGFSDSQVYFYKSHDLIQTLNLYVYLFAAKGDYAYIVDSSNILYVYKNMEFCYSANLYSPSYLALAEIDDQVCVVSERGLTVIGDQSLGFTYTFNTVQNICRIVKSHFYIQNGDETVCYKVSLKNNTLSLSEELDDRYYPDIAYDSVFKQYYEAGYYVYDFHEIGD